MSHYSTCGGCGEFDHGGPCNPVSKAVYQKLEKENADRQAAYQRHVDIKDAEDILRKLMMLPVEQRRKLFEDDADTEKIKKFIGEHS